MGNTLRATQGWLPVAPAQDGAEASPPEPSTRGAAQNHHQQQQPRRKRSSRRDNCPPEVDPGPESKRPRTSSSNTTMNLNNNTVSLAGLARSLGRHVWEEAILSCVPDPHAATVVANRGLYHPPLAAAPPDELPHLPPEEDPVLTCPLCGVMGIVPVQDHGPSCALRGSDPATASFPSTGESSSSSTTSTTSLVRQRRPTKTKDGHDSRENSTGSSSTDSSKEEASKETQDSDGDNDTDTDTTRDDNATTQSQQEEEETQQNCETLSQWLAELLEEYEDENNKDDDDEESIEEYMAASGAPKPIAVLAYHFHHCSPSVQEVWRGIHQTNDDHSSGNTTTTTNERWNWFRANFPVRTGTFTCPRPCISSSSSKQGGSPIRPDYAVVAGCTLHLLEWELMLQFAPTTTTDPNNNSITNIDNTEEPQKIPCTHCSQGHFVYDHLERLIPVFGDCGTKPSWIVSNHYVCTCCGLEMSGTSPEFLAAIPRALRLAYYPSKISWVQPGHRFQVTKSLAELIQRTLEENLPQGALRLEHLLWTIHDGLYAGEEMEHRLRTRKGHEAEAFPPFRKWLGDVDLSTATEIEELYRYASSETISL